jgi:HTH-type transcriptional regulator/antitoxin HigA
MIKNEKQYQITKQKISEFIAAIHKVENDSVMNPLLKQLQTNAFKYQLTQLELELNEYENLKNGHISCINVNSFMDIPEVLIKARIAKGWSHADLAKELDMKEQQVQRYEAVNYSTASISRLSQIIDVLQIKSPPLSFCVARPQFLIPTDYDRTAVLALEKKLSEEKSLFNL